MGRGDQTGEKLAYLCVDMLTALSRTRRRVVVFRPLVARGSAAGETGAGRRAIVV